MPRYAKIQNDTEEGRRTLEGLLRLRAQLRQDLPRRELSANLLLATWNLREFDSSSFGTRPREAIAYIAEVISHFDLVALLLPDLPDQRPPADVGRAADRPHGDLPAGAPGRDVLRERDQ